jgi:uncharacterized protein with HEPN domain
MREAVKDKGRIEHMLFAINNVEEFTANISEEEFAESKILFYAVVKNIEIIGEASYMLTKEFKLSHSNIPWQIMEKMRHVLVHGYYTISPKKVWETVQEDLPVLKHQLTNLLAEI